MKVLLVQLPVPDNRHANVPLSLGYLKAMAGAACLPGLQVALLEAEAQNRGGDAYLLEAILAHDPDLVGFSLYTWNAARSLGLAAALKQRAPEILIIGGGPEVNTDGDFVLAAPGFDFLVAGEGERAFVELLRALRRGVPPAEVGRTAIGGLWTRLPARSDRPGLTGQVRMAQGDRSLARFGWQYSPPPPALDDVNLLPSAYLDGALEGHLGRFMSIELSRWCPSRCTFCYYGRQDLPRGGKRYFDLERVRREILFGLERGVEQVHFVEANFNTLPHLAGLYETIRQTGAHHRMSFYAELRGEAITKEEAGRLAGCNFSVVEVGLQSAVPEVLARVRRKNNLPRLVQGVHNLREAGIEVLLDVILGLPGESEATFRRTLDFVEQHTLQPYDLFHLQVLSGTELKAEALAGKHGLVWQASPPYFVLETENLSFEKLCELRRETRRRQGHDLEAVPGLPQAGPLALTEVADLEPLAATGPVERVLLDLTGPTVPGLCDSLAHRLGSQVVICLKLGQPTPGRLEAAEAALQELSRPNPSGVWHIFVETDRPLTWQEEDRLYRAIHHAEGYLDRLAVFAFEEKDPARFKRLPSINLRQVLDYRPEWTGQASPATIWRAYLDDNASERQWRERVKEILADTGGSLLLSTPPGLPPAVLLANLAGLDLAGRAVWLADWRLAAGLSYAGAEDSQTALGELDYPLTALVAGRETQFYQPGRPALERAALRWALSRT